jgi:hypothetical protein
MQSELNMSFRWVVLQAFKGAAFGLAIILAYAILMDDWTLENTAGALELKSAPTFCVIAALVFIRPHLRNMKSRIFARDEILATMLTVASIVFACAVAVWLSAAGVWSFASGSTNWVNGSLTLLDVGSINALAKEIVGKYTVVIVLTLLFSGIEMWRFKNGHYHAPNKNS